MRGADCIVTDTWVSMGDKDGENRHNLLRPYQVNAELMRLAKPDALIMHPGPMNRGVEIGSEVADDIDRSLIREQVEMGVAVRMACLEILTRSLGNHPPVQ